jgi:hypothetical protein
MSTSQLAEGLLDMSYEEFTKLYVRITHLGLGLNANVYNLVRCLCTTALLSV